MYNEWRGADGSWVIIGKVSNIKTAGFFWKKYTVIGSDNSVEQLNKSTDISGYRLTIGRNTFVGDFYHVRYDYSIKMYTVSKEGKVLYAFGHFSDARRKAIKLFEKDA